MTPPLGSSPTPAGQRLNKCQRLDKWLWHARFTRSRTLAAKLCRSGRLRINRARIDRPSVIVKVGDVLTFPLGPAIRVVRVLALGSRRGPAAEARQLYEDLEPVPPTHTPSGLPPSSPGRRQPGSGHPTKSACRAIEALIGKD